MKAYDYAVRAVRSRTTPKYVKLQLRDFIRTCKGKSKKYKISEKKVKQLEKSNRNWRRKVQRLRNGNKEM